MELRIASATDRGRVRDQNEDSVLGDALPLVAVADGMGGHEGGEVASQMALERLATWKEKLAEASGSDPAPKLREAFTEAHRAVWDRGRSDESLTGMGTTLTAGWIDGDKLTLAHVGDSRAYLLRNGKLQQLTQDQTVAQEWVRRGRLSEDEAATSPHRHILLQAIGADSDELDIDLSSVDLRPGDRILLATDGLYGTVHEADSIRDLLATHLDPNEACRALVEAANAAGGEDNVSVVIVDVEGGPGAAIDDDEPVVVQKVQAEKAVDRTPAASEPKPDRRPRIPRGVMIAVGALVVAAVLVAFFVIRPSSSTLFVSSRNGYVAVLRGTLGNEDTPARGETIRVFRDAPVRDFPSPIQRQLRAGIEADTLDEAEGIVGNLIRTQGPQETPTPKPTPKASPETSPNSTPLNA
ncbi:MAG: PP2C family serine/threonine-protein phosphatase [Actinomycetota bacterium]